MYVIVAKFFPLLTFVSLKEGDSILLLSFIHEMGFIPHMF